MSPGQACRGACDCAQLSPHTGGRPGHWALDKHVTRGHRSLSQGKALADIQKALQVGRNENRTGSQPRGLEFAASEADVDEHRGLSKLRDHATLFPRGFLSDTASPVYSLDAEDKRGASCFKSQPKRGGAWIQALT